MPSFYPDLAFGWTFYGVLLGFLVVAAYLDLGRLVIPKKLTLAMLGVGVVFSLTRGIWMGRWATTPGVLPTRRSWEACMACSSPCRALPWASGSSVGCGCSGLSEGAM